MKGGINMKLTILIVALILVLGTFGGVFAVSGSSDDFGINDDDLIPEINEDDVSESERSAGEYLQQQATDILVSAYSVIEYSTGWYESDDGSADVLGMIVVRKEGTSDSGNQVRSSVRGKVHIGGSPFKIMTTERSASRIVYSLVGSKNDLERGDMILEKVKTYTGGISRWDGTITIKNTDTEKESLSAKVQLMTREKSVNKDKIKVSQGQTKFLYSGNLEFGNWFFKFASEKSDTKKMNAVVKGENVRGNMELKLLSELNSVRVYEGKLKAEDRIVDGREDPSDEDKISAVLRAEVKYNDNAWVGSLKATLKDGQVLDGKITINEMKVDSSPVSIPRDVRGPEGRSSDDSDDSFDDSNSDDSSDDSFDDSNRQKNKGFWKKFFRIFGGNSE